jgi:hypothetical protein
MSTEFESWYENAIWGNEDFKDGCRRAWDESRAALAAQAAEPAAVVDKCNSYIVDNARLAEANDALRAEIAHLNGNVHSCHAGCTRAGCVNARLRADAERYRWLRDTPWVGTKIDPIISYQISVKWDAAIDAAKGQG